MAEVFFSGLTYGLSNYCSINSPIFSLLWLMSDIQCSRFWPQNNLKIFFTFHYQWRPMRNSYSLKKCVTLWGNHSTRISQTHGSISGVMNTSPLPRLTMSWVASNKLHHTSTGFGIHHANLKTKCSSGWYYMTDSTHEIFWEGKHLF